MLSPKQIEEEIEKVPIGPLRYRTDERLSYCERFGVMSTRCGKNPRILIQNCSVEQCELCCQKKKETLAY